MTDLTLAAAIDKLRKELIKSNKNAQRQELVFIVEEIVLDLEVQAVVKGGAEISGEVQSKGVIEWLVPMKIAGKARADGELHKGHRVSIKMKLGSPGENAKTDQINYNISASD